MGNPGRTVVCDNYFSGVPLADRLYGEKTYLLGTLRPKRISVCADLLKKNWQLDNLLFCSMNIKLGKCRYSFYNNLYIPYCIYSPLSIKA